MNTRRAFKPWMRILLGLLVLAALLIVYLQWRGPLVPGYRVAPTTLVQNVVATGRIVSLSRSQIGSEITGVVTQRLVKEGDSVEAGDLLLVLRDDGLQANVDQARAALRQLQQSRRPQAQARLRQAESQLALAQRNATRAARLLQVDAIAREEKEQVDQTLAVALAAVQQARLEASSLAPSQTEEAIVQEQLAAAEAAQAKTRIHAQAAGTILTRNVEPGDLVQPGKILLEMAHAASREVLLPVDERNLGVLKAGQSAVCVADAYPQQPFAAAITLIAPSVDPQRGTVDVRLRPEPAPAYLRDDLTVTVSIETGRREQALAIPNDALLAINGSQASAFVVKAGKLERTALTLGLRGLTMTEVTQGLVAGDWVVAAATLQEGQRVRLSHQQLPAAAKNPATSKEPPMNFN